MRTTDGEEEKKDTVARGIDQEIEGLRVIGGVGGLAARTRTRLDLSPSLAELETHMNLFTLAAVKLTASGHGENPYRYFEMFIESVKGFPVIRQKLAAFLPRTLR